LLLAADLAAAALVALQLTAELADQAVELAVVEPLDQLQTVEPECNQTYQECPALLVTVSAAVITHLLLVTQDQAAAALALLVQTEVLVELLPEVQDGQVLSLALL
jgi:hypothetical protein